MSFCPECNTCNGVHEDGCRLDEVYADWFELVDDGTLDTVFRCGRMEFRFSDTSEFRDDSTGELDVESFMRNNLDSMWDELRWEIESELETRLESWIEYETKHDDAGSNYSHCFAEDRYYWQSKLEDYVAENFDELPDDWRSRIKDIDFEIRPGHIFSGNEFSDGFGIGGFPVGEVELQDNVDSFEFPPDAVEKVLEHNRMKVRSDGTFYQYGNTDAVWLGIVTDESIDDCLAD